MRIDGQRADLYSEALNRVGGATQPTGNRTKATEGPTSGDRIDLSTDAQRLQAAMKGNDSGVEPAIRTDLVNRMREALLRGEIGKDPGQLADALIDHLITK